MPAEIPMPASDLDSPASLDDIIAQVQFETEAISRMDLPLPDHHDIPNPNSSFSLQNPFLQIAWDSTSLGALKTCKRLYFYLIIMGYTSSTLESPHLKFGIVFHSATETYERGRASGLDHKAALILALRHALEQTWDSDLQRPWVSPEPTKTRNTLLRTIVWYLDKYEYDSLKTVIRPDGTPAVELPFRFSLNDLVSDGSFRAYTGEEFQLCGYLDKLALWNDDLWIPDKKTTKGYLDEKYFNSYSPDNQVSCYSVAGMVVAHKEVSGVVIDAAQVLVNGSRFQRKQIPRSLGQLAEWLRDLRIYLAEAEKCAQDQYWPQNDKACGLYGGCQFRRICSADPEMRLVLLDATFTRRVWDPLQPR